MRNLVLFIILLIPSLGLAQPGFDPFLGTSQEIRRPAWRKIANMFTFEGSVGHGATFYSHDVSNLPLVMTRDSLVVLGASADSGSARYIQGLRDWLNVPVRFDTTTSVLFSYAGDSVLGFEALNHSLPVSLRIYFNYDRFRIGGGVQYEWQWFRPMNPTAYENQLGPYRPRIRRTTLERYYGMVGARVYTYRKMSYAADLELGMLKMGVGLRPCSPYGVSTSTSALRLNTTFPNICACMCGLP